MNLEKIIEIDVTKRGSPVQIGESAVAGDSGSRSLCFRLTADGMPWTVPDGVRAAVAFRTEGGTSGEYDQMPDGSDAFSIDGSTVTVQLIDPVMASAGTVKLMLVLRDGAMGQLSTFPILMEVTEGIEGAEPLPVQYYRIRDLEKLNAELERILALVAAVDTQANLTASEEARAAAEEAKQAAGSVNAGEIAQAVAGKGDDVYVEDGRLYLTSNGQLIGVGVELPSGSEGLAFDSGYVDEGNLLHLTLNGADIEGFTPFAIPAGGGGDASVMTLTTSLAQMQFSILDRDESCVIPFSWSSMASGISTGSGFAEWIVGGSRVALVAVEQGENSFDIRKYLADGTQNIVVLKVTDVYAVTRMLTFAVTVTSYGLSWNLAETGIYAAMGLALRLTPTGSGEKVLKVAVDGTVISETTVTTTGRTVSVTVPVQSHGAHTVKAWLEVPTDSEVLVTEPLVHVGVWLASGVVTPVIALLTPEVTVGQYGTAAIRYFVVDPGAEATTVALRAGDAESTVLENVDRSVRSWYYKATAVGELSMAIICGTATAAAKLTVTSLGYDIVPVTAGLELDLDPAGRSNEQTDRAEFGYLDADGVNHPLTFSENFDWVNGGFQTDADGVTAFVVRRGTTVTLDRGLFDTDCRAAGRNIKLIFRSENVRNYDAELMSCKSGNVGLVVNAQQATVTSQLETMTVPYGNGGTVKVRAKRNTPTLIECPTDSLGDTETYIFSASHLTAISSLAALKPKFVLATTAQRLRELIVGSGEVGYQNLNLNQIGVGSNGMLELLDLRGCPNLVTALDLSALTSLEEFYGNGSGLTGVTFARSCPLRIARVPAVSSFVGLDLTELETFVMDGTGLLSLRVENCPAVDTLALCKAAAGLERGRLTGVDWTDDDADTLVRLTGLAGFNALGKLTNSFVLTGKAHVAKATQLQIDAIKAAFPELELSYDAVVPTYTVTFCNYDDTVADTQLVTEGSHAVDPVASGRIGELTKPSDVEYHYTRTGWDTSLQSITADTVIKAVYTASDRYYTFTWWSDGAETAKLLTKSVIAHGSFEPDGLTPVGTAEQLWVGWDRDTTDAVCDLDIHPVFLSPKLPETLPEEYDYIYSDDPDDVSRFTASVLYGILYYGLERTYLTLGDRIRLKCSTENFADTEIILELRSFKHFLSAETAGAWAGPYFGMVGLMNAARRMNAAGTNEGGWPESEMCAFLEEVVYPGLPQFWRALMERIIVHSSEGNTAPDIVSTEAWLTLESQAELGFDADAVPYVNEVAAGADEVTFACYTDNASRVKKTYNGTGSAGSYWLRSPLPSSTTNFCHANPYGNATNYTAAGALGVAFGFCLRSNMGGEAV